MGIKPFKGEPAHDHLQPSFYFPRCSRFVDYFLGTREELFFEVFQSRIRNSKESMRELRTLRRQAMEARAKREKLMGTMTMVNKLHVQVLRVNLAVVKLEYVASDCFCVPHRVR
jgi:hypothetical protein